MALAEKQFTTSDLPLAAVLAAKGFKAIGLDRSNQRRVGFVFWDSPELRSVVELYWDDGIELNPRLYHDATRRLKSWLYGGQHSEVKNEHEDGTNERPAN